MLWVCTEERSGVRGCGKTSVGSTRSRGEAVGTEVRGVRPGGSSQAERGQGAARWACTLQVRGSLPSASKFFRGRSPGVIAFFSFHGFPDPPAQRSPHLAPFQN